MFSTPLQLVLFVFLCALALFVLIDRVCTCVERCAFAKYLSRYKEEDAKKIFSEFLKYMQQNKNGESRQA